MINFFFFANIMGTNSQYMVNNNEDNNDNHDNESNKTQLDSKSSILQTITIGTWRPSIKVEALINSKFYHFYHYPLAFSLSNIIGMLTYQPHMEIKDQIFFRVYLNNYNYFFFFKRIQTCKGTKKTSITQYYSKHKFILKYWRKNTCKMIVELFQI